MIKLSWLIIWRMTPVAMFGALYRLHFPLTSEGKVAPQSRSAFRKNRMANN